MFHVDKVQMDSITCQEYKPVFVFSCLEGAIGAIWTNPASQGSKMVRVFDFWRQNGAKINPKGNGAKKAFFRILAYFRKSIQLQTKIGAI